MPVKYDKLLMLLKERGITSYTLKRDNIIGQATFKKIKEGGDIDTRTIAKLCRLLSCQPGDILIYDEDGDTTHTEAAKTYLTTGVVSLPLETLEQAQAHANARGESVNGFIGRAIRETLERDSDQTGDDGER